VQKHNKTLNNYPEIMKTTYMTVRQIMANIWLLGFRGFLRTPKYLSWLRACDLWFGWTEAAIC